MKSWDNSGRMTVSEWIPIITALAGIGGALGSQWLSHHLASGQEKKTSEDKLIKERFYIGTELVFMLEQFAEGCALVTADSGSLGSEGYYTADHPDPTLDYSTVAGDWRALLPRIMYKLRELPVLQAAANRQIVSCYNGGDAPEFDEAFFVRQYQYAKLGIKAVFLAQRLRALCGMPVTRLSSKEWSAQPALWQAWREKRHRLTMTVQKHKRSLALSQAAAAPDTTL